MHLRRVKLNGIATVVRMTQRRRFGLLTVVFQLGAVMGAGFEKFLEKNHTAAIQAPDAAPQDAPAFLRRSFGSGIHDSERKPPLPASLFAFIATRKRFISALWRRHFSQSIPNEKTERPIGKAVPTR